MNYFSIATDPITFVNPALSALTIFTSLGAAACFVLPLKGMDDRIAAEKRRLRAEANTRLEATIQQVYRRADTQNLTGIDQLNQLMASLITTRDVLARIPTIRPWSDADFSVLERTMGDPNMTVHLGGPESPEKLRERHERYRRIDNSGRGHMLVIVVGPERLVAGSVG